MGWKKDLKPSGEPGSQIDKTVRKARRIARSDPSLNGNDAVAAALPKSKRKLQSLVSSAISSGDVPVEEATNGCSFEFYQHNSWKSALRALGELMADTAFHRRVRGKFKREIDKRYN